VTAATPRAHGVDLSSDLLAEAASWRLISLLLERPRAGWHGEVEALTREVTDAELAAAPSSLDQATEGLYLDLLGPGGPLSAREVAWRPLADPGRLLAELEELYRVFAYCPRREDPADHLAVSAGFVAFLILKRAYAEANGDAEAAEIIASAIRGFLADHLAYTAEPFARRLEATGLPHLRVAARALDRRVGPAPPPLAGAPPLPLAGDDPEGCCGFQPASPPA